MRLLITGLAGTLAPHLARAAREAGHEVIGWNRAAVPPGDPHAVAAWLDAARPDAIAHLAMGASDWAARLAAYAAAQERPFVFTSSAMVFHHEPDGPHAPTDVPSARDDYGRYKIACEEAIRGVHPQATIARIGWQIDADAHGNNMLAQLGQWQARDGGIGASRCWRPACSFMADTAAALLALLEAPRAGIVHLDSNARDGHPFDAIVTALAARFGRGHWVIVSNDDYRHDQRLVGHEAQMPSLSSRLPALLADLPGSDSSGPGQMAAS